MTIHSSKRLVRMTLCAILLAGGAGAQAPLELGNRLELFVDAFLIDHMDGVSLRLHEPQPAETVLTFDQPWEGRYCGYVTVFKDENVYRMYYRGLPNPKADGSDQEVTCYAESADGIHWTKPNLGLFEVNGTRENNCILARTAPFSHNFAPYPDTRPGVPPEERYKALAGTRETGLAAFISGDGIHWKKWREAPVITQGAFDSQNVAFWSETEHCYVCYLRTFTSDGFRTVSRCTSTDFLAWTDIVAMDFGGTPMEQLYTNQTIPYYRAPHLYVAIAARFMPGRRVVSKEEEQSLGIQESYGGDCSDNVFMTSRGGNRYDRTFMEAFIKPGIGMENWTSRTNYPARGIVPTGEKEMSLYIQQNYGQPTGHLTRYTLRPDGFVSADAPYSGGEFTTKPFTFTGKELSLNFATSAAGSIKVELQDPEGIPLPGFTAADSAELIGNMLERVVRWNESSDIGALAGKALRLRFLMKDASLYALRFQ